MRWAEIVAQGSLDDSRDGLNLMLKTTLQVEQKADTKDQQAKHKTEKATKIGVSWKDALLGTKPVASTEMESDVMETVTLPMLESTTSNGLTSRKRLAQEMDKDKAPCGHKADSEEDNKEDEVKEKRRKKNEPAPNVNIKAALDSVRSPIFQVRRIKSWASDSEEESEDEDSYRRAPVEMRSEAGTSPKKSLTESLASPIPRRKEMEPLTEQRMSKRQKQIDIGKATVGYQNYLKEIKPEDRIAGNLRHPVTPSTDQQVSKRAWDVIVRSWRRALHLYDDPGTLKQNKHIRLKTPRPRRKRQPKKNAAQSAPPKTKLPKEIEIKLEEFPEL